MVPASQHVNVRRFNDLILFRVREVLLVSSPYDHFILQEDGSLTERVFFEYEEFSLSAAPRFTHAPNAAEALKRLDSEERRFDLILVMTSVVDMDLVAFARRVKEKRKNLPVVLLNLDQREQGERQRRLDPEVIDGTFVWTGDSKILLAIDKYVEDKRNVEHDVRVGNVRVILMVEDSPRYYSLFLQVLYTRLMKLAKSLYAEGQTKLYRLMYMRSRPKLVHATSYEIGMNLLRKYRSNMFALISDVSIPREGRIDARAGLDFAREARGLDPHLPILLQSAEPHHRWEADSLEAAFVDKNSSTLVGDLESFLDERLGFSDFIFRTPGREELGRARDLRELELKLETHAIPDSSLVYHARHNHFSLWLMARSEFELAESLRPQKVEDFVNSDALRQHIVSAMRQARETVHSGIVADFKPERLERDHFSRIGSGYLGGKARGIAFLNKLLAEKEWEFPDLPVALPKTIVVTTAEFDRFMENNQLREFAGGERSDDEISRRFLECRLSEETASDLRVIAERLPGPLAVRSSSLLEDSLHQPFAGIYSTLMIPNNDASLDYRYKELCCAVKLVYASIFHRNAKSFLSSTGRRVEEEKMAVIVQELVGKRRDGRFYPSFSGVAQSHNYYPIGPQRPEEGVALLALGLGRHIVEGGRVLRFSPRHPHAIPQFGAPRSLLEATQREFLALDVEEGRREPGADLDSTVRRRDLRAAETDGALIPLASVYCAEDEQIRDDLSLPGPRVVTFNNILKHHAIPLAEVLCEVLGMASAGMGGPAEVEFACEMGDWGWSVRPGPERKGPRLYLLQLRPLVVQSSSGEVADLKFRREDLLCASELSLGHGALREIRDVVYVRRQGWDSLHNPAIAGHVDRVNSVLVAEKRPYVLIGPGRWGSSDRWLGIPVQWSQISGAKVMVEASPAGYDVDPSQGTHFFHNITSLGIGYLTLPPGVEKESGEPAFVDWGWLDRQPAVIETERVRLLRFEQPLTVALNGRSGSAVVAKPGAQPIQAPGLV